MKQLYFAIFTLVTTQIHAQNFKVEEISIAPELVGNYYKNNTDKNTITVIIPGSGPTDRNGNQGGMINNSLKLLAEGLANNDYDVLTYDKRIVYMLNHYKEEKKEIPILDFKHGIDDAKTIVNYLKNQLGYKNIVLIGHSEGSLIGMIAAQDNTNAFISIAGAGRPIDEILKEQINKQAPMLNDSSDKILIELKQGKTVKDVNPFLQALYAEHNQPYLIEWIALNPTQEVKKLNIPILLINGTKDIQVSENEAKLLHEANPKSEVVIIENMNHILKKVIDDKQQMKTYTDPDLPIQEELITIITNFLRANQL